MKIVAKYGSKCGKCGGNIEPGDRVEWSKGKPAVHDGKCAKGPGRMVRAIQARRADVDGQHGPTMRREPDESAGEILVSRPSRDRTDNYSAGQVMHALRTPATGGGADKHVWTVVAVLPKWRDDDTDAWMISAIARPATAEEAAPGDAARAAKAQRTDAQAELREILRLAANQADDGVQCERPAGRSVRIDSAREWILAEQDGHAIGVCEYGTVGGDDYRPICCATRSPRAIEIMQSLLGGVK